MLGGLLWAVVVILVILWLLGFAVFHLSGIIHLVLVVAVIVLVWNLIMGSRSRRTL
ncbi:MAG TPA: lmo0937 family membrane protein [Ktedonobacteraceae bacterium]